jgi:hypothetical protein
MLIASHPREVVFNMAIDEIILSWQGKNYKYRDDPSYNASPSTYPNGNYRYEVDDVCKNELAELSDNRITPFGSREDLFERSEECNYTKFKFWLRYLLDYGLTARLLQTAEAKANGSSAPSPTTNTIASKSTSSSTGNSTPSASTDQLCFDELLKPSDLSGERLY